MKSATWRTTLLALCVITALFTIACALDQFGFGGRPPWYGLFGASYGPSGNAFRLRVLNVDAGGSSDLAGVRPGDLIDIRSNTLAERLSLFGQPLNKRPIALAVQRSSAQRRITVVPGPPDLGRFLPVFLVGDFGSLWLLLFAALIAWRRSTIAGNLLLATVLVLLAIVITSNPIMFALPWSWAYMILFACNSALAISVAVWATFASTFAQPLSRPRQIARWTCYALVGIALVTGSTATTIGLAPLLGLITLWFDPVGFLATLWSIPIESAISAALVCSVLAIASSRGIDRQRAYWSLLPFAGFYVVISAVNLLAQSPLPYATMVVLFLVLNVAVLVMPILLTYVALSRRLIDIGFVLNRTVVFAILSAIVVSAFVVIEWAASEWLAGANRQAGAIVSMAAALALGLSLRYIHGLVDRFVDRAFFGKRHDQVAALRQYALQSAYVTKASDLLARTRQLVVENTGARDASILTYDGVCAYVPATSDAGDHAAIDENDPGILALRAGATFVDLTALTSSRLHGEFAFPMVSRGVLHGVLLIAAKRDGDGYAPDEFSALSALALATGAALDTLANRSDESLESIKATQAAIIEKLDSLASLVDAALPPIDGTAATNP